MYIVLINYKKPRGAALDNKRFFIRAIGVCGLIFILSAMVVARFF